MQRKIRVLVGKPGLDGHDRGAKVVAAALRDAGMEVIYTGLHQTPEQVVEAAVQEDVDVVALSILSGAHMTLFPEVLDLMRARGIADRLLTGGGIIPAEDMETLARSGVGRLFGPGASTRDIAVYIREWFIERHGAASLAPMPERPAPPAPELFAPTSATPAPRRAAAAPRPAAKRRTRPASRATATPKRAKAARAKAGHAGAAGASARRATRPATRRPAARATAKRAGVKRAPRRAAAKRATRKRR